MGNLAIYYTLLKEKDHPAPIDYIHQLPIVPQLRESQMNSSRLHAGMLTDLISCKSCAGKHSCFEHLDRCPLQKEALTQVEGSTKTWHKCKYLKGSLTANNSGGPPGPWALDQSTRRNSRLKPKQKTAGCPHNNHVAMAQEGISPGRLAL